MVQRNGSGSETERGESGASESEVVENSGSSTAAAAASAAPVDVQKVKHETEGEAARILMGSADVTGMAEADAIDMIGALPFEGNTDGAGVTGDESMPGGTD